MTAIVRDALAWLLAAPMTKETPEPERVDQVFSGMAVEVLEVRGRWRKVKTPYRYEGWTLADSLEEDEKAVEAWEKSPLALVLPPVATLLSGARPEEAPVYQLPRAAAVARRGEPDECGWQMVEAANGALGFLPQHVLRPLPVRPEEFPDLRESLARAALDFLKVPYLWGGKSAWGIDCSGLVSLTYLIHGIAIFRDAKLQPDFPIHPIPRERMEKGDLLYFPGHVALYLGEGRYVHATGRKGDEAVVVNSLDPAAADYRADLAEQLLAVGSYF